MPKYMRLAAKFTVLLVLVAVLMLARPTNAAAFTCQSDCLQQRTDCLNNCFSLPFQPDEGCFEFCQVPYLDCVSGC